MKTAFFPALWGVCCGTRIFPALCKNSVARVVWHLFLMSFFCGTLIALGGAGRTAREWDAFMKRFDSAFGSVVDFSSAGILPAKSPEEPRFIKFPEKGGLLYTAGAKTANFPVGFISGASHFTVWSRFCIIIGVRTGNEWQLRVVSPDLNFSKHKAAPDGLSAFLNSTLARAGAAGGVWNLASRKLETGEIFRFFKHGVIFYLFVAEVLGVFLLGVLCTAFFAGISRLTGAATLRGLDGWEYWKVGVYAGFPGMLVGAVAAALELPYLSYGAVYSLVLVVYWLPASLACAEAADSDGDRTPRT